MKNKLKINTWLHKTYTLNTTALVTKSLLTAYISRFWNSIVNKLATDTHLILIVRIKFITGNIRTIGHLQRLNKTDMKYLIDYINTLIGLQTDAYLSEPISEIIFDYGIRKGLAKPNTNDTVPVNIQRYYNKKLPLTFNPLEYGKLLNQYGSAYSMAVDSKTTCNIVPIDNDSGKYNIVDFIQNNILIYSWKDTWINEVSFTRELGKSIYTIVENQVVLVQVAKPSIPIKPIKQSTDINMKFITMDIETRLVDNKHVPYLICWYAYDQISLESKSYSYFISDFKDIDALMQSVINDLFVRKYDNYKVYLHNLAKFDGIFLLKLLANIDKVKVKPIIHNGRIISINVTYKNYQLQFKDSYLLLLASLRKLGKSFNVEVTKGIFPFKLNDLNYNGEFPDFAYFTNLSENDYNLNKDAFGNNIWNFKQQSIEYCLIDCISLYQILIKFNNLVFDKWNLNINDYVTLPSFAFGLFRSKNIPKVTKDLEPLKLVYQISGDVEVETDIRTSYTGGAVDMYVPTNNMDELVYCYDVNSLYPFVMSTQPMPVGSPTYFEGDIRKLDPDAFGFFYCKVISPDFLEHPIIQTHVKTSGGLRTMAPLGQWEGMLFSKEMDNAIKYGYKFEILRGYTFNQSIVFDKFINELYTLRLIYPKSDPMNYIAKLLMNSLYGRYGMSDKFTTVDILNISDYHKFENKYKNSIVDVIELGNKMLVTTINPDNDDKPHNINIAIASAITAYARIHMSQFKNNPDFKLFYTDTDSAYINKPLPDYLVGNKLGQMKLENVSTKAVFLAPKVYGQVTDKGDNIIKIKGLGSEAINNLDIGSLESLLVNDSKLEVSQDKWFKSILDGSISIKDQLYTLRATFNKRELVYSDDRIVSTNPYTIDNSKEI